MWILRSSPPSPFGRKVKIAAAICGLSEQIEVKVANTADAGDSLRHENPLGKIPALILEDGTVLYDSRVIVEWLDRQAGGGVVLPTGEKRFAALTLQALADGLMDASILQVYEVRHRPEERRHSDWTAYQEEKVTRALRTLEAAPPALSATPHIGQIAVACALGYRDLRFDGTWRRDHPRLVAWLDDFAARVPSFEKTKPAAG